MRKAAIAFACLSLTSCTTAYSEKIADSDRITLKDAVFDVTNTMDAVIADRKNKPKIGIYLDEATVVFNVSAKRTTNDKGGFSLALAPPQTGQAVGITGESTLASEANRGNTITLKFKNVVNTKGAKPQAHTAGDQQVETPATGHILSDDTLKKTIQDFKTLDLNDLDGARGILMKQGIAK
ncbi:hypothetical protein DSM25558_3211 [Agrobacterium sp. DSM 25558]|uniref:hypothetical protein n=1 Tax=Agrobacterium sp. DSM 25558 TaxID=1907665 RepID=UPI0009725368|nr:hypothetical protein [Agrobacterium sp. DSM 25558]SCX22751.1 hypothetical protein DSM25558_3211 [Agrobacterium sp. DSM 25558]